MSTAIAYFCANPQHRPLEDIERPFVIHLGARAYCPLGAADGHDWRRTTRAMNWGDSIETDAIHDGGSQENVDAGR